jgi:hypothetical protein
MGHVGYLYDAPAILADLLRAGTTVLTTFSTFSPAMKFREESEWQE